MLPGNSDLIKCPHCGGEKEIMTLMSGNTFGAVLWSDCKQEAPMLPRFSPILQCPQCKKFYFKYDQPSRTSDSWGGDTGYIEYPELKQAYHQLMNENLDEEHERCLRNLMFYTYNDYFYRQENPPTPTEEDQALQRENIQYLLPSINNSDDGKLLCAEFYREMEMFEQAKKILDEINSDIEELNRCKNLISQKVDNQDSKVFILRK